MDGGSCGAEMRLGGADPWEPKPAACASFLDESVSETELTLDHSRRRSFCFQCSPLVRPLL